MKNILFAFIALSSSQAFAFELKCEAAVGPRLGRPTTEIPVTYKNGYAYLHEEVSGYTFSGGCSKETCEISINNPEKLTGFISTNASYAKINDYGISLSYYRHEDDTIAEITCNKVKLK